MDVFPVLLVMEMSMKSEYLPPLEKNVSGKMSVFIILMPYLSFSRQLVCWPLSVFFSVFIHTTFELLRSTATLAAPGMRYFISSKPYWFSLIISDELPFDRVAAAVFFFFLMSESYTNTHVSSWTLFSIPAVYTHCLQVFWSRSQKENNKKRGLTFFCIVLRCARFSVFIEDLLVLLSHIMEQGLPQVSLYVLFSSIVNLPPFLPFLRSPTSLLTLSPSLCTCTECSSSCCSYLSLARLAGAHVALGISSETLGPQLTRKGFAGLRPG